MCDLEKDFSWGYEAVLFPSCHPPHVVANLEIWISRIQYFAHTKAAYGLYNKSKEP